MRRALDALQHEAFKPAATLDVQPDLRRWFSLPEDTEQHLAPVDLKLDHSRGQTYINCT